MDNLHARRAVSFGSVATAYSLHRPDYPDQAVAWALGCLPDRAAVLDLAAGTGKVTEAMLRCGIPAAAVVGQAFHWFDPDRALSEIARVLRSGGVLAALGNVAGDSVGWVAELMEAAQAQRSTTSVGRGFVEVPEHPAFGGREERKFRWNRPRTIDSLLETTSTRSWALVSTPNEREAAFGAIRQFLEQHPTTRDGVFELPMQTLVLRTTRLPT